MWKNFNLEFFVENSLEFFVENSAHLVYSVQMWTRQYIWNLRKLWYQLLCARMLKMSSELASDQSKWFQDDMTSEWVEKLNFNCWFLAFVIIRGGLLAVFLNDDREIWRVEVEDRWERNWLDSSWRLKKYGEGNPIDSVTFWRPHVLTIGRFTMELFLFLLPFVFIDQPIKSEVAEEWREIYLTFFSLYDCVNQLKIKCNVCFQCLHWISYIEFQFFYFSNLYYLLFIWLFLTFLISEKGFSAVKICTK